MRGAFNVGLVPGIAVLAAAAVLLVRWRRAAARRRGGHYTPAEFAGLDDHGLAAAAEWMLLRDGWHVIAMPVARRPRLYARDRGGRQLDVRFPPDGRGSGRGRADRSRSAARGGPPRGR
ncbi:hypothetical protein ACNPQM_21045 [Streptomyces sp. NPDC056231]|uniref:hypothetical protein n=1 Tax=Streptomyces sp. NPDC056231 TaxID=3345755 RepID=UPI003AAA5CCF